MRPFVTPSRTRCCTSEVKFQTGFGKGKLPKGAIHGDLFCDNVLFAGDRVAGIIDFGFAATDFFAYDLAITVNDWCVDGDGTAALDGCAHERDGPAYDAVRPLTARRARAMAGAAARRRACASGCRGSTTCICRAPAS